MHHLPAITNNYPWRIYALGDDAVTIDFGNSIHEHLNKKVVQLFTALQKDPLPGMMEAVPAYSSLTVYYDIFLLHQITGMLTVQQWMMQETEKRMAALPVNNDTANIEKPVIDIPVCYEAAFATDMDFICYEKKLAPSEVIRLHTSQVYRVYMTGFLPGFPYMGETPGPLHVSRKKKPVAVVKGSVGLAGKQTGIYPLDSPGGWQIIGQTPLAVFDATKPIPVLLQPGDRIQFYSISSHEFANY